MPSLRSRFITLLLKNRHLLQCRLSPPIIDWATHEAIVQFRQECEQGATRFGAVPKDLKINPVRVGNISAEWISPVETKGDHTILFIHGGGYVSGSCSDHRIHVAKFVKGTAVRALLYDYRLAPEHPFPAALTDTLAVYQWLLDQGIPSKHVVFAGDSAGGGLCLAALLALRDQGIPLPAAAAVLSPWTDLTCSGDSYQSNSGNCLSPQGTWTAFSRHYAGDQDPGLPLISPLHGELYGLPPVFICAAGDEILRDDAIAFAHKARSAKSEVTLLIEEGLFHCYPVCAPLFPEATRAMEDLCGFMRKHLQLTSILQ